MDSGGEGGGEAEAVELVVELEGARLGCWLNSSFGGGCAVGLMQPPPTGR